MREEETVYPNDTTRALRKLIKQIKEWTLDNPYADPDYSSLLLDKLIEAELLSLRIVLPEPSPEVSHENS